MNIQSGVLTCGFVRLYGISRNGCIECYGYEMSQGASKGLTFFFCDFTILSSAVHISCSPSTHSNHFSLSLSLTISPQGTTCFSFSFTLFAYFAIHFIPIEPVAPLRVLCSSPSFFFFTCVCMLLFRVFFSQQKVYLPNCFLFLPLAPIPI